MNTSIKAAINIAVAISVLGFAAYKQIASAAQISYPASNTPTHCHNQQNT